MGIKNIKFVTLLTALLSFSSVCVNAAFRPLELQVRIFDPRENQGPGQRGPEEAPSVSIEDYTLSLDHSCLGCTLRLVDENDTVVYTTIINGDTLMLPSTLSGEYELQILFDDCYFYGWIEL